MTSDFLLKPGHLEYYLVRLWIIFKPSVLTGLFWHHSDRAKGKMLLHCCQLGIEVQVPKLATVGTRVGEIIIIAGSCGVLAPHVISTHALERVALLLLSDGVSPNWPLGLLWQHFSRVREVLFLTTGWGESSGFPCVSTDTAEAWGFITARWGWNSQLPTWLSCISSGQDIGVPLYNLASSLGLFLCGWGWSYSFFCTICLE